MNNNVRIRTGVKLSSLTKEIYKEIIQIYDRVAGTHHAESLDEFNNQYEFLELKETLANNRGEYRLGSTLTIHTKIIFSRAEVYWQKGEMVDIDLIIWLDPNNDINGVYPQESLDMMKRFEEEIIKYLQETGISIDVRD